MSTALARHLLVMLPLALALGLGAGTAAAVPDPAPHNTFDVWEYQVKGNTTLDDEGIEKAVYPFLGPDRTFADVEKARAALEKAYRDAGFATVGVDIPEQAVSDGVVELQVVEGRVDRVQVSGARYFAQDRILAALPAVREGEVPNFNALRDQLADVNRGDDRRVQPLLRPGHAPATTEVELKVDDSLPVHGSIEFNNRYSPSQALDPGKYRLSGTLRYDNLWQREHSLSLSYLTSPGHTDEAQVTSASYTLPFGGPGRSLTFYGVHSNSNADLTTSLAGTNILGHGDIAGLRYNMPIASPAEVSQNLTLGADFKHFLESLNQTGAEPIPTPLTYWLGMAQYSGSRTDTGGDTSAGATAAVSVRGLRNNDDQFDQKRFMGQSNFAILRWELQRLQHLPWDFALVARLEGQVASRPLPSNEEYAAGGADSVRGYPEGTQMGDHGLRGMLELRTPNLMNGRTDSADLRLLTFYDGAELGVIDPLPGQIDHFTLASYGFGLRLAVKPGFSLSTDYAWRLKDGLSTDTHGPLDRGGRRLHFAASFQF